MVPIMNSQVLIIYDKSFVQFFFAKQRFAPIITISKIWEPFVILHHLLLFKFRFRSNNGILSVFEILLIWINLLKNFKYVLFKAMWVHIKITEGKQVVKHLHHSIPDHQPHLMITVVLTQNDFMNILAIFSFVFRF